MRKRRSRSLAMGGVKRAEVILLAVGLSHRKVRQGSRRSGPHYPQGHQAVNILESALVNSFRWCCRRSLALPDGMGGARGVHLHRSALSVRRSAAIAATPSRIPRLPPPHFPSNCLLSLLARHRHRQPATATGNWQRRRGCLHSTKSPAMMAAETQENDADPSFRNAN